MLRLPDYAVRTGKLSRSRSTFPEFLFSLWLRKQCACPCSCKRSDYVRESACALSLMSNASPWMHFAEKHSLESTPACRVRRDLIYEIRPFRSEGISWTCQLEVASLAALAKRRALH